MAFVALPPELRSLCGQLTSSTPEQLPILLPRLLKDLGRCGGPLSEPSESKVNAKGSEAAILVHKLRTQISSLLNGRSPEGRFAAVTLVKAFVETGGWESLRSCEPWVRGLVSILQKRDRMVTKELCIVTLTKIYLLVQKYQTLVREIASPTLPAFASACLQMLTPSTGSKAAKVPLSFIETLFEAFSTLIPLYPTTLRPSATQIRAAVRPYLAPTASDGLLVPESLQASSRRLVVRLHMTAAKAGESEEWVKHCKGLIQEFHVTADQVFRAVQESWESNSGYRGRQADFDSAPSGGGSAPDQLPPWTGVQAGSERLVGLLKFLADCLRGKTKTPVTVPVSALIDLTRRVSSIALRTSARGGAESTPTNAAAGREEKADLWTAFPMIQVATMELLLALSRRLELNYIPLAQETLDHTQRMFDTSYRIPEVRSVAFSLSAKMLQLCGPHMSKVNVDRLALTIQACCQDLLGAAGFLKKPVPQTSVSLPNGTKSRGASSNADAFLSTQNEEEALSVALGPDHIAAAEQLLSTLFSCLPQQYINSSLRARMLRTAILCRSKDAQLASVLHPSRDKNGKIPAIVLPFLHRQFPHDESVEILRFNFRPISSGGAGEFMDDDEMDIDRDPLAETLASGPTFDKPFEVTVPAPRDVEQATDLAVPSPGPKSTIEIHQIAGPFSAPRKDGASAQSTVTESVFENPLKRKSEELAVIASKRVEVDGTEDAPADPGFASLGSLVDSSLEQGARVAGGDSDSDDESVHLDMALDSDGEDDEADEEE